IMTDPELADRTYIEPITLDVVEQVIQQEHPDALLPTMGGQTALNTAVGLAEHGILNKYGVQLIGASYEAMHKAENRNEFKHAMARIGLKTPTSAVARSREDALRAMDLVGFPAIVRPSFTWGGTGGNIAYNREEVEAHAEWGLSASPVGEILVERSVIGWKEFELEVVRDTKDNVIIVCSIENFDPMGVHTGDSITVAPAQTLTDKEYQRLRQASLAIIREIGVDTGGSNIQFGVHPTDGRIVVVEVLASGRTVKDAYLQALRSLEGGRLELGAPDLPPEGAERKMALIEALRVPRPERPWFVAAALREGMTVDEVHQYSAIDPWF